MKSIYHASESRGKTDYGWLKSRHSFSFGKYYDSSRIQFGALRVLNDDKVKGGAGFDTHPHANMEIVTIPIKGALEHKDSTGRHKTIKEGEVQIMSAGSGIRHSEYNADPQNEVHFLQIWILPEEKDIPPRYEQKDFSSQLQKGRFTSVVDPLETDALWINQKACLSIGDFKSGKASYIMNRKDSGVYVFMISGEAEIEGELIGERDGLGLWELNNRELDITVSGESRILLIEVPIGS